MRNLLSASLKILTVLFLLGVGLLFTPSTAAQSQTLTGWFTFMVADYQTESGLTSEMTYFLTEDSGEQHELLIDIDLMRPLGGPVALNRKRVTVMGEWEEVGPDATEQFRVYSIELAASPSTTLQWEPFAADSFPAQPAPLRLALQAAETDFETDSHVRGSQAWVSILCRFADLTDITPHPVSYYEKLMGSSEPGLAHYWKEVSYGNIPDLRGSIVVGWYNLPRPRSYYVYDWNGDGEEDFDSGRLARDCTDAAEADVFFPDFDGINLFFNGSLSVGGFGGGTLLKRDGEARVYDFTALSEGSHDQQTVAHEMGHAFGLLHSSGPYDGTYDSGWDVVSGGGSYAHAQSDEFGEVGVHTIAYHKDYLGWIPADRKYVAAPNTTRTITLERLAKPGAEGYLMAQIPIGDSTSDFYTVEARRFAGYDDGIPDEAVVIHKVDTTREDRLAQVVDIDKNGDPNDEGAMWTVGETFTDADDGIQVSVDAKHATSFQVTIAYTVCAEALSSMHQLLRGQAGSFSVGVVAPSGCRWIAKSDSPWLTVITGSGRGSGSAIYSVAANTSLRTRTGTLIIGGRTLTVTQTGVNDNLFEDDMSGVFPFSMSATFPLYGDGSNCHEDGRCVKWELTTASSHSGPHAWTDSLDGNYRNDLSEESLTWLGSPEIDLTWVNSATLTFWHRYHFASGDKGVLKVYVYTSDSPFRYNVRTFTGSRPAWHQESLDLSPYSGKRIEFQFFIESDARGTADGWYIDDVAIFSPDFEPPLPPDPDLCQDYGPCSAGQGDCDPGQCARGLVCVNDVGAQYGLPAHYDVCEVGPDPDFCQKDGPCSVGQGDCDPGQCGVGLVCANDVGAQYGLPAHYDVCEADPDKILFEDDMESGVGDWGEHTLWALTTTVSRSGTHAWSSQGKYQGYAVQLDSPWIDLTSVDSATLTFWHRSDFASTTEARVSVAYFTEDGEWKVQALRYFTGTRTTWQQVILDLTPFVGRPIYFIFDFAQAPWFDDRTLMVDGWYIDDVVVYSSDSNTSLTPDPDYCRDHGPCSAGQGDCDPGQCADGLVCVADVGPQYGLPAIYDVCEVPSG